MQAVGHPRANYAAVSEEVDGLIVWAKRVSTPHNHLPRDEWLKQQEQKPQHLGWVLNKIMTNKEKKTNE